MRRCRICKTFSPANTRIRCGWFAAIRLQFPSVPEKMHRTATEGWLARSDLESRDNRAGWGWFAGPKLRASADHRSERQARTNLDEMQNRYTHRPPPSSNFKSRQSAATPVARHSLQNAPVARQRQSCRSIGPVIAAPPASSPAAKLVARPQPETP